MRANALRCLPYAWGSLASRWEAFTRALEDPEALVRIAAAETLVGFRELPEGIGGDPFSGVRGGGRRCSSAWLPRTRWGTGRAPATWPSRC